MWSIRAWDMYVDHYYAKFLIDENSWIWITSKRFNPKITKWQGE